MSNNRVNNYQFLCYGWWQDIEIRGSFYIKPRKNSVRQSSWSFCSFVMSCCPNHWKLYIHLKQRKGKYLHPLENISQYGLLPGMNVHPNSKTCTSLSAATWTQQITHRSFFSTRLGLEEIAQEPHIRPLSCEKDLESYEQFAVENRVYTVVTELQDN